MSSGEITLKDALEQVQSSTSKGRKEKLQTLIDILRHKKREPNGNSLDDLSFHYVYEVLFQLVVTEQSTWLKANAKPTASQSEVRLSSLATALRLAVELGASQIKVTTARAVLDHVMQTLPLPGGAICTPLAREYVRCLNAIIAFQPHLDHLPKKEWEIIAQFCVDVITNGTTSLDEEDAASGPARMSASRTTNGSTSRASRSQRTESSSQQAQRLVALQVTDDLVESLNLLTAAPNSPSLAGKASIILKTVIHHLKNDQFANRPLSRAFATINHVLAWLRTEDMALTKSVTSQLVRLAARHWSKGAKAIPLTNEILVMLIHLRPYMACLMRGTEALTMHRELRELAVVLRSEYARRPEHDQLQLRDLRLAVQLDDKRDAGCINTAIYEFRPVSTFAEQGWAIVETLAVLYDLLGAGWDEATDSDMDDIDNTGERPRKRQRREEEPSSDDLLALDDATSPPARSCALQVISMYLQKTQLTSRRLERIMLQVMPNCAHEDGTVASWALLALASCASQSASADVELQDRWDSVWRMAQRGLSNSATSRAACYVELIMFKTRLVGTKAAEELRGVIISSGATGGPTALSDSASQLLCQLVQESQHLSPRTVSDLAQAVTSWLIRKFSPSLYLDRNYAESQQYYEPDDVANLISACVNAPRSAVMSMNFHLYGLIGQTLVYYRSTETLCSYLLLQPPSSDIFHHGLRPRSPAGGVTVYNVRLSCETMLLDHFLSELQNLPGASTASLRSIASTASADNMKSLFNACCVLADTAFGHAFRDTRRQVQLQAQVRQLLQSVTSFAQGASCSQDTLNLLTRTYYKTFSGLRQEKTHHVPSDVEKLLSAHLADALRGRGALRVSINGNRDSDHVEWDDGDSSQDERRVRVSQDLPTANTKLARDYSLATLRATAEIYAVVVRCTWPQSEVHSARLEASNGGLLEYLRGLSAEVVTAGSAALIALPRLGVQHSVKDTEALLDCWWKGIMESYSLERSEAGLSSALDIVSSLLPIWTQRTNKSLYSLSIDIYEWFADMLDAGFLSPIVTARLASMLLQLCKVDADFGHEFGIKSARTTLFSLLRRCTVTVLHGMIDSIPMLFNRFVLSKHEQVFDDLRESLPDQVERLEGLAMRLMVLARLASSWPSLRRLCVYYVFETAARVQEAAPFAKFCVQEIANALHFDSPQELFRLYAPQLLFTWLDKHSVHGIPYATFGYTTLEELSRRNDAEISAQLIMRCKSEDLQTLSSLLNIGTKELAQRSFAKAVAYAIGCDISRSLPETSNSDSESYLRSLFGSKDEYRRLIAANFAPIIGQMYLSMQHEDAEEKWLEKRTQYASAAVSLTETKKYSHSSRKLPAGQQPHWKGKLLFDQIDRLGRRITRDVVVSLWSTPSFSLAARVLLDSMSDALGPLHLCAMLRKLRLLICTAGDIAFSGYPLQLLIESIRPLLSQEECADDALGILWYLLHHGVSYLTKPENAPFTYGSITSMVLQMRRHCMSQQESTTQGSQRQETVQKMEAFQSWLVGYLTTHCQTSSPANREDIAALIGSLKALRLPGNARKDSAESRLLLLLLRQSLCPERIMSAAHCDEILAALAVSFEPPADVEEDCLGEDAVCVAHSDGLWYALRKYGTAEGFVTWAGAALGRAYASSGYRPNIVPPSKDRLPARKDRASRGVEMSYFVIGESLCRLLFDNERDVAGLAEWTLRSTLSRFSDANDALTFDQTLLGDVTSAIAEGSSGYQPHLAKGYNVSRRDMATVSASASIFLNDAWLLDLAVALCQIGSEVAVVSSLTPILQRVPSLTGALLPSIVHIMLAHEIGKKQMVKLQLSEAITNCLANPNEKLHSRQRALIEVLLYLRRQRYPGEKTKVDRAQWLDVDSLTAADAACRLGMSTASLIFAENMIPSVQGSRRTSSRASLSQIQAPEVPNSLLLRIFAQIDEPDSYYGVQQSTSFGSVLERLDYEGAGYKTLMYRSAQMDSSLRVQHHVFGTDTAGLMHALSSLHLDSLQFALLSNSGSLDSEESAKDLVRAAHSLRQWDLAPSPDASQSDLMRFSAFQELSRATDRMQASKRLQNMLLLHARTQTSLSQINRPPYDWCNALAVGSEALELVAQSGDGALYSFWEKLKVRNSWLRVAQFEQIHDLARDRSSLFSVLAHNPRLLSDVSVDAKKIKKLEIESHLEYTRLVRGHDVLQESLSAAAQVDILARQAKELELNTHAAAQREVAAVLWATGEAAASVQVLKTVLQTDDLAREDIPVGEAGLRAQLASYLAQARLEKPEHILANHLQPAIKSLRDRTNGADAGEVFFQFATFCDNQLQTTSILKDIDRAEALMQEKKQEYADLRAISKDTKKSVADRNDAANGLNKAKRWFDIYNEERQRLKKSRDTFIQQSLQNYMLTLQASDDHDMCVLRFFALWFDNAGLPVADSTVQQHLATVPSWKFAVLLNQLVSRLEESQSSTFQSSLKSLVGRICAEHPLHSLHHLYAATIEPVRKDDNAAVLRYKSAMSIRRHLESDRNLGDFVKRFLKSDSEYDSFAATKVDLSGTSRIALRDFGPALQVATVIPSLEVPPATLDIPMRPDGNYAGIPHVQGFGPEMQVMHGNSHPKVLTARASDGKLYKELFKGVDDLRQDAIMEQVFGEVSKLMSKHKATRQRNLVIRTYKVIPLTSESGIMEFVANSIPIGAWLKTAHPLYYPNSMRESSAKDKILGAQEHSVETRINVFRKVCEQMPPVLRFFFIENFDDPDEWFARRTAYTRTTAAISMLGHVLGLGDRHNQNILLDSKSGEVVHIDLGIAFEAGRILRVPELVPFRLTRDIVDGMGITKTEGVFRRCCEFTMDALREDKDSIMTLLNVLRYDPLVSWTISPLRAKRMQDAQETGRNGVEGVEASSRSDMNGGAEADRALGIIEKKLSKTLSTSAVVNELIQQATDEKNLATLYFGWGAYW